MNPDAKLEFVVGAERKLTDLLNDEEVLSLLHSALSVGFDGASVIAEEGEVLWQAGETGAAGGRSETGSTLLLEGEPVGQLRLYGGSSRKAAGEMVAAAFGEALNRLLYNNLKRVLTTEIHTRVVNQSYDELLEANRQLAESERKYRDLAQVLDDRVKERTAELHQAYAQMLQQEKMAAVGQLAAGIAHEINNPLGFILSNLHTLRKYLDRYRQMVDFALGQETGTARQTLTEMAGKLKLDYVGSDSAELLEQSINGAERVKTIISDLRGFSHVDDQATTLVDLNEEMTRTLRVMAHEISQDTRIDLQLAENLPLVPCQGSQWGQVFLNLMRNACQAKASGLELRISTAVTAQGIRVVISDNGPGIQPQLRARIFEPFFTTKDVGQGTGMGLALVFDVVRQAGGRIEVDEAESGGARFTIHLPIRG